MLEGLDGVLVYMDDILVFGATIDEHDRRLNSVLQQIKASGLKLNKNKCEFAESEMLFLGHKISCHGMLPDTAKVTAIVDMSAPTDIPELKRFLGMTNYLGRYAENLSTVLHPLNTLLRSDVEWTWGVDQQRAFIKTKNLISTAMCLAFYEPTKPTTVSADSSSYGIAA